MTTPLSNKENHPAAPATPERDVHPTERRPPTRIESAQAWRAAGAGSLPVSSCIQ